MDIKHLTLGKVVTEGPGLKAGTTLKAGQMLAYASVFGNVDSYGDVVVKGAFANTLAEWRQRKDRTIPLLYGHNMSDPNMNVGAVLDAEEDDRGLKILAQFDDDAMAQKVYRLVKAGRVAELSFAFDTVKSARLEDPDRPDAFRELQELKLYEVSVVPIGANSETEVLAIKAAAVGMTQVAEAVKAGRTLSKANESSIRSALEGISAAKDALEKVLPPDPEDDDETEEPDDPDTPDAEDDDDEDPKGGVTSDQRGAAPSADAAPILGEEWTKALTVVVSEALETVLKAAGVELPPPPSDPEARAADMLVTEIQLMELGPSE